MSLFDNNIGVGFYRVTKWALQWALKEKETSRRNNFHCWLYFCDPVRRTPSTWNLFYLQRLQILFQEDPQMEQFRICQRFMRKTHISIYILHFKDIVNIC